jgi:hypothetical protein
MIKVLKSLNVLSLKDGKELNILPGAEYSPEDFCGIYDKSNVNFLLRNGFIRLVEEVQQPQFEAKQYKFSTEFATEKNLEEKLYTEQEILELGLDKTFEELLQEQSFYETKVVKPSKKEKAPK